MKRLQNFRISDKKQKTRTPNIKRREESVDMILNRLISGSGMKRRRS